MRSVVMIAVMLCCVAASVGASQTQMEFLDSSHDQIVKRVVVPSVEKPHGEVQLIRRGNLLVVQTLLASPVLKRVVAAIDTKEQRKWPEANKGIIDSSRYREELFRVTQEIWKKFRQRSDKNEKRQYMVIEFILGFDRGTIALSVPQVVGEYGQLQLVNKETAAVWRPSTDYMTENIKEIVRDSFNLDNAEAEKLLEPLWPVRH